MGQISVIGLEGWVEKRILGYFNRARSTRDVTEGMLKDDPNTGAGSYIIGDVVARRILDRRNALPGRRFTELMQLSGIQGLGTDKYHDLIYTFSVPAAEAFKQAMYHHLIGENWQLEHDSTRFEDTEAFLQIVDEPEAFRKWLARRISTLALDRFEDRDIVATVRKRLKSSALKTYSNGHIAAFAFALWFYQFDADNWFSFERVRKEVANYLDFMPLYKDRAELRVFEGFDNLGILAGAITVSGLPVVVNYAEQTISIWSAQLND